MVMAEATNHYFKHLGVSDGLSPVSYTHLVCMRLNEYIRSATDW